MERGKAVMRVIPFVKAAMRYEAQSNTAVSKTLSADSLVSIVIVNLERGEDLRRNIESLKETVNVAYEVVIVDNGSKGKETLDYLDEIDSQATKGDGRILVHRGKENLGNSQGRRLGIELALKTKAKYILTVDNDVAYTPGWVDKLISEIEKSEEIGAVSPLILNPHKDGKLRVQWNGGKLDIVRNYFMRFVHLDIGKVYGEEQLGGQVECDWLLSTAILIKKDIAKRIGFSTSYLNGFEDYDYSFQIAELGYKMLNVPDAVVMHHTIALQDGEKQKREANYLRARRDYHRMFESIMAFIERTGFNPGMETNFHTWRYNKDFLTRQGYPDLLGEGRSFNDVSVEEARRAYEAITKERIKKGIAAKGGIDMEEVFGNIPAGRKIKLQQKIKKYSVGKSHSEENRMIKEPLQVELLFTQIAHMAEVIDELRSKVRDQHLAIIAKDHHINNLNEHNANLEEFIRNLTREIVNIKKYSVFYNLLSRFRKELLIWFGKSKK